MQTIKKEHLKAINQKVFSELCNSGTIGDRDLIPKPKNIVLLN